MTFALIFTALPAGVSVAVPTLFPFASTKFACALVAFCATAGTASNNALTTNKFRNDMTNPPVLAAQLYLRPPAKSNCPSQRGSRGLTGKIRGVVNVPAPVVCSRLRISADRPRSIHHAVGAVGSNHLIRRRAFLEPPRKRAHGIESIGTVAAPAMTHARQHKEANRIGRGRRAHGFQHA